MTTPANERGGDPRNNIGERVTRELENSALNLSTDDLLKIARALREPTPEFLARAYTAQELADALAIKTAKERI